ncbi:hypothetical protein ACFQ9V_14795 [Leifsonia sp. NPDC056665]
MTDRVARAATSERLPGRLRHHDREEIRALPRHGWIDQVIADAS